MEEKDLEITKEELRETYHIQRRIYEMEEKFLLKKHLLLATERVLDIRDVKNKIAESKNKELKDLIKKQYLRAVTDLMDIVYSILNEPPFCFIFEEDIDLEDYIVLEMEDMVLVNGYLRELKPYNSNNIDLDTIFMALNESIFDYINCLKEESDYSSEFDDDYIQITEEQGEDDE